MIHQREIKFRAWDINSKKMFDPHFKIEKPGDSYSLNDVLMDYGEPSGHILLQFTGLRDKAGKEIFEGDIIKAEDNTKVETRILEVKWDGSQGCFGVWMDGEIFLLKSAKVEVIGNAYENPELLK